MIKYSEYTHIGGREENQDASIALHKNDDYLFVVADGLGGYQGGQIASSQVIETIFTHYMDESTKFLCAKAILMANKDIITKQQGNIKKMNSTVAAVYINEKEIECVHVGDTRIYLFGKDNIIYQSDDHSVAYVSYLTGEITLDGIRTHNNRNVLTRTLGSTQNVKISRKVFPKTEVYAGLICSDGFWEYVYEEEMLTTFQKSISPEDWLKRMRDIHQLRVPNEHDNNTAIVFTIA